MKNNKKYYRSLERSLYLSVQATIDLADAVVSLKKLRKPTSLSESFDILQEQNIIARDLTNKLVSMTGFRNVLAHGYTRVDFNRVYEILHNGLKDIEDFIENIQKHT